MKTWLDAEPMRWLALPLVFAVALLLAGGVAAQGAPATAKTFVGKLTVVQWPLVEVDGKRIYAAPGARIVNTNKLTVTPNMVAPKTKARIELDDTGQIRRIDLLLPP